MGIGAPSGYAFPRSKQQISFSGTGETPLGKFLFYKVQYALRNNLSEISLSDDELKEFKSDIDITAAPNSVELCFQIISDSVHDLDEQSKHYSYVCALGIQTIQHQSRRQIYRFHLFVYVKITHR